MAGNILAVGFYTPWMLSGILLASLPIIIHYWFRRNYQVTEWAAIQFLLSAVQKHSRRIRLEQIILLTIRFLILALVSIAMAEPFLSGGQKSIGSGGSVHRILVIDSSYSMGKRDFKKTQFEKAVSIGQKIVDQSAKGDFLSLFQISSKSPSAIISEPTLYHDTVRRELNRMSVTNEAGNLTSTIQAIQKVLKSRIDNRYCEIIILTDMQKSLWYPVPDTKLKEMNHHLNLLAEYGSVRLIDVGNEKLSNLGISSLKLDDSFVVVDRPTSFSAEIRNYGRQPVKEKFVELYVNDHLVDSTEVDIPAGQSQVVSFSHVFNYQGSQNLEVRLADDALPADQKRWLCVNVQKALKILLVNGREADNPVNQATFYLQTVLSSQVSSGQSTSLFDVDLISTADWDRVDLTHYNSVFIVDVPDFQKDEALKIRQFVVEGGGLVICMGNQVDAENYNRWNLKSKDGFFPLELLGRAKSSNRDQSVHFLPENFNHPVLKPFEGNPGTGLESTVVLDYMKLKVVPDFSTKIPLRFDSGDPVFTETLFGKGKVFVITTSADISWGSWAVQPSFPPLIYELVKHIVSGRWEVQDISVGSLFQIRFPNLNAGSSVSVTLPDGAKDNFILSDLQEESGLMYSKTEQVGVYQVYSGNEKQLVQFAVNLDSGESDLNRVPFEMIKNQLSAEADITYTQDWKPEEGSFSTIVDKKTGINRGIIILVLSLFFVELLMSWKFSYGLGLLTFFGLLAMIYSTSRYLPILGWGVFVIAMIVILFLNRSWFKVLSRSK